MGKSIHTLKDTGQDMSGALICWAGAVGSGVVTGAVGTAGNPLGIVIGGIAGLLIGSRICGKGQIGREAIKKLIKQEPFPKLPISEQGAYIDRMRSDYGIETQDAIALAQLAISHVRRGGYVPSSIPSRPQMKQGLHMILKQKPI